MRPSYCSLSLLCLTPLLVATSQLTAQQTEDRRLSRYLEELGCRLDYLSTPKSTDGKPVVGLWGLLLTADNIGFVAERMDYIAKHTVVRSVSFNHSSPEALRDCLTRLPNLEEVRTNSWITPDFLKQLQEFKNVRSLVILADRFGDLRSSELPYEKYRAALEKAKRESLAVLGTMQQLRALDLSRPRGLTDADLKALAGLKHLEELDVSESEELSDEGMKGLSEITSLRKLRIENIGFTDVGLARLKTLTKLELLRLHPLSAEQEKRLKSKDLSVPKLTGEGMRCLQHFPEMRDLTICMIPLDPEEGLSFLRKMPRCQNLDLSAVPLTFVGDPAKARKRNTGKPEHAFSDFSEFAGLKELRHFRLNVINVELSAFKKFPTAEKLESFELSGVFGAGTDLLPLLSQKAPNLQSLTLRHMGVFDWNLRALHKLKHLKYLGIDNRAFGIAISGVTANGVDDLLKAIPGLEIDFLDRWGR